MGKLEAKFFRANVSFSPLQQLPRGAAPQSGRSRTPPYLLRSRAPSSAAPRFALPLFPFSPMRRTTTQCGRSPRSVSPLPLCLLPLGGRVERDAFKTVRATSVRRLRNEIAVVDVASPLRHLTWRPLRERSSSPSCGRRASPLCGPTFVPSCVAAAALRERSSSPSCGRRASPRCGRRAVPSNVAPLLVESGLRRHPVVDVRRRAAADALCHLTWRRSLRAVSVAILWSTRVRGRFRSEDACFLTDFARS